MRALRLAGVALRRCAGAVAATVQLALEGRAALARGEGEGGGGRIGRVARLCRDRRVRRRGVDRERPRDRRALDIRGGVGRANADGVVAVGGEVRGCERERPGACPGCGPPVLAPVGEVGAVPVEPVRDASDRDLDAREGRAAGVGSGAREVVPGRGAVEARGGRERDRARRVGRVDRPREARGRGVGVTGGVAGADFEGVRPLREARVALGRGAGRVAAAVELALERRAALAGGEGEGRAGRVRRIVRLRCDRRVRRRGVDLERPVDRRLDVRGRVGCADADRVVAVGGEVRGCERERPGGCPSCGAPVLDRVGEGGAVPVEAVGDALDRDLDVRERCAAGVGRRCRRSRSRLRSGRSRRPRGRRSCSRGRSCRSSR